jgi:hypothetical protein
VVALREERCLPAAERGPVESLAFARFARVRCSGVGDWGLGIGAGIGFIVIGCAGEELAGKEGAGEPIFAASSCGHALLRASQRSTESVVGVVGAWAAVSICVTSVTGVARAGGDLARRVVDVVGWAGKIGEGVA